MENTPEDLAFLPYLLDEEIYLIDTEPIAGVVEKIEKIEIIALQETIVVEEVIVKQEVKEVEIVEAKVVEIKEEIKVTEIKVEEIKIEKAEVTVTISEPKPDVPVKAQKAFKKIVILVGYPSTMPATIAEALLKIFSALQITMLDIEIINVLDPAAKKIDDFTFSYLILMGGTGKNIEHLKDFAGTRNRYDIAVHKGSKIYFAEAMDVYMKPENIELKKKFWAKLKEVFGQ